VGEEVAEAEEVRWIGFRATGGAAFLDVELVVEVERRRSIAVCGWGGGGFVVMLIWDRLFVSVEMFEDAGL
jgi:hypothetical protein